MEMSTLQRLRADAVRLLRPCGVAYLVHTDDVFRVAGPIATGGIPDVSHLEWHQQPIDLNTAVAVIQRDLYFTVAFGIRLDRSILDLPTTEQDKAATGATPPR